jgi:phosphoglucosamine mutase
MTVDFALNLASAAARVLAPQGGTVLIGKDTRLSGYMFESALEAGFVAAGVNAMLIGPLPTPGIAYMTRRFNCNFGVVISASHNPYQDNGIKLFGPDGFKLADEVELAIEQRLEETSHPVPERMGRVRKLHGTLDDYLRALRERFAGLDLSGLNVLLDCANGATFRAAPEIFRRLGATVTTVADHPDGRNINDGCGSTHVEALAEAVVAGGHALGFAFDGDGDRVLAADRTGAVVDGDELLALAARHLYDEDRLGGGVVVTVMTNYGFHVAMEQAGIEVAITQVGDRYVLEELRARGWALGGEQSGHVIDMGFNATGDGIASALLTLEALAGRDLADRGAMDKLPQRLVNVPVADREAAMASEDLRAASEREAGELQGRGRVLVRPSGTEQLVRVMVEAPTAEEADAVCERLVEIVRSTA